MKLACIGSGNMGGALMRGAAKLIGGNSIVFTDADRSKAEALAKELGAAVSISNAGAADEADAVFLAVKPQVLPAVLEEITPVLRERINAKKPALLVSMAAGFSIETIKAKSSALQPVIRIMPNTPVLIGQGVIILAASSDVPEEKIKDVEKLFSEAGICGRLEEKYLDAVTALSGSGPAFAYLFIEALADGGVKAGLPRDKALLYAAQTLLGSAAMVKETGKHPGELKDMVASPGGTTIAGIAALEKGAFRGTVMAAVEAAFRRAGELG
ncbi:pyrroline-5-carboxylate reductase [Treponema sp. OttesenSCG-928-L16]|nr:pyrroline-5-carboxylate reductase [Treponema sp. OttesenSCG-928-L16]